MDLQAEGFFLIHLHAEGQFTPEDLQWAIRITFGKSEQWLDKRYLSPKQGYGWRKHLRWLFLVVWNVKSKRRERAFKLGHLMSAL